jgi:hypothetical protein
MEHISITIGSNHVIKSLFDRQEGIHFPTPPAPSAIPTPPSATQEGVKALKRLKADHSHPILKPHMLVIPSIFNPKRENSIWCKNTHAL